MTAARPGPGQQISRALTVSALDGSRRVDKVITFRARLFQSSSRAAIKTLAVRLDPSVLRLSGRRGGLRALIDNRNGTQPIRVTMRGDDPENIVRFTFAPGILDIPPGQVASSSVTLTTSWAPAGDEVTRPFVILASDGRLEVQADGSIIQSSAERRPLARLLLTLFGALAMILGALLPWWAVSDQHGVDLNVDSFAQVLGSASTCGVLCPRSQSGW